MIQNTLFPSRLHREQVPIAVERRNPCSTCRFVPSNTNKENRSEIGSKRCQNDTEKMIFVRDEGWCWVRQKDCWMVWPILLGQIHRRLNGVWWMTQKHVERNFYWWQLRSLIPRNCCRRMCRWLTDNVGLAVFQTLLMVSRQCKLFSWCRCVAVGSEKENERCREGCEWERLKES